jgi:hypothetical protein
MEEVSANSCRGGRRTSGQASGRAYSVPSPTPAEVLTDEEMSRLLKEISERI